MGRRAKEKEHKKAKRKQSEETRVKIRKSTKLNEGR
jgi:hypothetical protein